MAETSSDLIVIGCGVHGLMVAMVAAEQGHTVTILDKAKPGQATSGGWYGILHGGLRYLQTADLRRFRESVTERRWFAENFPDQIVKLLFLMPLYGRGLKRPSVFYGAFLADALAGWDRNRGVDPDLAIKRGQVLSANAVNDICAGIPGEKLQGGALWEELIVPDTEALFSAMVSHAERLGVTVQRDTEVIDLRRDGASVIGVQADVAGQMVEFSAPVVVNAAGPWAMDLNKTLDPAQRADAGWAMAFNLLLKPRSPAQVGLSVFPAVGDGDMLFLYPRGENTFAGTWYYPFDGKADGQAVSETQIDLFLTALNGSLDGIHYDREDVLSVMSGLLPVTQPGTTQLSGSDQVIDHGSSGGPRGLYTQIGVKYTTARSVARKTLRLAKLLP